MLKRIAGILMLLLAFCLLSFVLLVNSGHTSSFSTLTDDILCIVFGLICLIGGGYAVLSKKKK